MSGMDRDIGIVPEFFLLKQNVFGIIKKNQTRNQNKETLFRKSLWRKCFSGEGFLKAKLNEDIQ
jgi:hypothetical protein